jgi:hypothetical protein
VAALPVIYTTRHADTDRMRSTHRRIGKLADSGAAVIINGRSQNNVDGATRRLAKVEGIAADLASAAGGRARSRSRLYRSSPIRL